MKLNKIILLNVGLLLSSLAPAENFVCGVDLNGNGDIADEGETASCTVLGGEPFCSIGALSCTQEVETQTKYGCNTSDALYSSLSECSANCLDAEVLSMKNGNNDSNFVKYYPHRNDTLWFYHDYSGYYFSESGEQIRHTYEENVYERSTFVRSNKIPSSRNYNHEYRIKKVGACKITRETSGTGYSCPIAGNSCYNNNGIMQCNPNKCINLDTDALIETIITPTMEIDDGVRNSDGACMDQSSLFAGRNISCRKAGTSTAFKNCCKGFDKVIQDNTGSSSMVGTLDIIEGVYNVMSAGYEAYKLGGTVSDMSSAMEGSITEGFTGIDPYSIAISLAIQFALEYLLQGCNQQDMESGMLNSSGYCVEVGEYCAKKWKIGGCVQKAKSRCCYNSKMARIIQEQGKPQLGLNFGTATSPNCAGLTPQQFQRLDFSKIDMSEYYADIQSKADFVQENISNSVEKYYKQIGFDHAQ